MLEQVRQTIADAIAPNKAAKPTKTEKERLDEIKQRVEAVDNTAADREDTINLAYFRGKQHIAWDKVRSVVYEPITDQRERAGRTQYTANRLIAVIQKQKAKVFKNRVIMEVAPATPDEADHNSAELATRLLDWLEYDKKLQKRDSSLVLWGLTTRIAWIHPYWNAGMGAVVDELGTHEGDIDYDVLSCFEVKFDPSATTWEDVRWACKIKVRDIDFIKEVYGVEVKPEKGLTANNIYDSKMDFSAQISGKIKYTPLEHHARVFEFWELPSGNYPNGRRVTYTKDGDKPLYESDDIGFGPDDDTKRELPFFPFVAIDLPGSVSGTCTVEQVRPLLREYNRTRSQLIDNKDLMAYPKLAIQRGSMEEEIDNEIGAVWEYDDKPPGFVQPPQAGADAYQNCSQILEELDYVSGQSQVSHGSAPSDASGYLVQMLIEQDDTIFAPTMDNYIDCKQAYMSYSLKMIHSKYIAPRKLRIVGTEGVVNIDVEGASINSYDVRIQRGSLMSTNKTAKRAEVLNLLSLGVLGREEALRHLEFGTIDAAYNEIEQDEKQARNEQIRWEAGQYDPPEKAVRDFFNHDIHIKEHNRWRKTKRYEQLPPNIQAIIDMHVDMHQQFQMMGMMAQMPMGSMPPEGGNSPGTPHNPENLEQRVGNGGIIGNSMQGGEGIGM